MTFNQMRAFIEVANCHSFSTAAQNLYISQPNLTKYIANLEKELNMKLFHRSTHHVALTPEGQALLQRTELLFSQLSRNIEEVQLMSRNQAKLANTTIGLSMDELLPPDLTDFLYQANAQSGDSRYILVEDSFSGLIHHLRNRSYDMVISSDKNVRKLPDVDFLILRHVPLYLAVNRRHPLSQRPDLSPTDFGDTPVFFALPDGKDSPKYVLDAVFSKVGGPVNLHLMDTPGDLLINVQIGAGIAIVSGLVDPDKYPEVVFRRFDRDQGISQALAWQRDHVTPAVQRVIDYITTHLGVEPQQA
jgi:DNA-binding transcriptional LysR family regulator